MSPSFDCTGGSSLFCAEDDSSLMCFDEALHEEFEDEEEVEDEGAVWYKQKETHLMMKNRSFFSDFFLMGFPMQDEESFGFLVKKESDHLPRHDYFNRLLCGELDIGSRRAAVDWIRKTHDHMCFGPLSAYLSISYMDRFLSVYDLPKGKAWSMQLLAVSCLSIAAKMEETEVPLFPDLQVSDTKFVFEAKTIQRMELLVLGILNWRMQAVTPFSFIDYFLYKMNNEQTPPNWTISRCIELILSLIKGIEYLKFRPSEFAAAVAMSVLGKSGTADIDSASSCFIHHLSKERVLNCLELIQDVSVISGNVKGANSVSVASVPHSPIGVLDAACLSYKSDELTVGSCANSSHSSPEAKKRKLNQQSELD